MRTDFSSGCSTRWKVEITDSQHLARNCLIAVDRIRNADDRIFIGDQSQPMKVEHQGEMLVAEATIGVVTLGTMRTKTFFR